MNLKKTVAIATAAGALAAISVPAMAFENEFHGMYRAFGYFTNAYSGGSGTDSFNLAEKSGVDKFIEQRARIQYIAKASDDLKLVTHFELDAKFGGASTSSKYVATDGGGLDADRLSLETKSVYLDFNCPITGANVKVGMQPYNDSFGGLFGNFDATGVTLTKKFNDLTASYGYFTVGQSDTNGSLGTGFNLRKGSSATAQDLNTIDLKYAVNKNLSVGASYYMLLDKIGDAGSATVANNTVGLNAAGKVGPVALSGVVGLQFGKSNTQTQVAGAIGTTGGYTSLTSDGSTALAASLAAKVAVGPGSFNLSALYLSGDPTGTGYNKAWQPIGNGVTYFTPANMWLLTRNAATINSSTAIGGSTDLTRGGLGLKGVFAGYEGAVNKVFYNANVGYAAVDKKRAANSSSVGTEVNLTVGYQLFANMSASATAAYAILGDGYGKSDAVLLPSVSSAGGGNWTTVTANKADNPFLTAIQLNYAF